MSVWNRHDAEGSVLFRLITCIGVRVLVYQRDNGQWFVYVGDTHSSVVEAFNATSELAALGIGANIAAKILLKTAQEIMEARGEWETETPPNASGQS